MAEAATVQQFSQLLASGQHEAALQFASAQLAAAPLDAYWLNAGALALHAAGQSDAALNWMGRAIALAPERPDFHNNYGVLLRRAGNDDEAIAAYRRVLALKPDDLEALRNLVRAQTQLGREAEALASCESFCAANSANPVAGPAALLAGHAAMALKETRRARRWFTQACTALPQDSDALRGLAQAAAAEDDLPACEAALRQALVIAPQDAELLNDLGACLAAAGRYDAALTAYDAALAADPDHYKARYNRGTVRLRLGQWVEGWRDYESRLRFPETRRAELTAPLWDGQPLSGTLLVHAEQGLGDTLQFLRFVPAARARCQSLILEVQPALLPLLQGCSGVDQLIARGQPLPASAARIPLLSLPDRLGITLENLAQTPPYLPLQPALPAPRSQRLQVGLVWFGNPKHSDDRHRSLPAAALAPLLETPGVDWHSLQYGLTELPWPNVRNRGGEIGDWRDTARLIQQLDLLISVDTSVAHLAASLG
ncbi:MAG TPA: tetratricopeptide repeat protein, partial [Rhodocyclaceae bacterium]|nr:tetratricopeptide repeat protein [Rhodocyclaceae bacterium]